MKRSKFTESQIAFILRQGEEGTPIAEVCRKAGISEATFYNWRNKYGGLMPSEMKRLRQLEEENGKVRVLTVVDTFTRLSPAIDVRQNYRGCDVVVTLDRAATELG